MILAILQARISSSRLPGKVLLPVLDRPLLELEIERLRRAKYISKLLVATSQYSEDDLIASLCEKLEVDCFRGSLEDVLDRYYQAAKPYHPEHVVRVTGDCPLIDPGIIDNVIELHVNASNLYTSNTLPPTFPDGLDVEVFSFHMLEQAWINATLSDEREHVTPWIKKAAKNHSKNFLNDSDQSNLRWTLDYQEDYLLIKEIVEKLYPMNPNFGYFEILSLVNDAPRFKKINKMHVIAREKYE